MSEILRYLKSDISQGLTRYETSTAWIGRLTDNLIAFRTQMLLPFLIRVQNGRFAASVTNQTRYSGPFFLHEAGQETLEQLYNYAVRLRRLFNWYVERTASHPKSAEDLIDVLRKRYHLED